jgi:hypothetical protein
VATGSRDREGSLLFADGELMAVFVLLDPNTHDEPDLCAKWYLEAGFGPCATVAPGVFATLDEAQQWVCGRILAARRIRNGPGGVP